MSIDKGVGRTLILGLAFFACSACSAAPKSHSARKISSAGVEVVQNDEQKPRVVFVGSSSVAGWKSLSKDFQGITISNLGVVGSTYGDLVKHFDDWVRPSLVRKPQPKAVVVYSGDNDLAKSRSIWDIQGDVLSVYDKIRSIDSQIVIYLLTVKVSPARVYLRDDIERFNDWLGDFARQHDRVVRVDVATPLWNRAIDKPSREYFTRDGLHLNKLGYGFWSRALCEVWFSDQNQLGERSLCVYK